MEQPKSNQLSRILIKGFKSIYECDLSLNAINILIGANGAGKSNFIGFFKLAEQLMIGHLQPYVTEQGGPDALLHFGRKKTTKISTELHFKNNNKYKFSLSPTFDNRMMFDSEIFEISNPECTRLNMAAHFETLAKPLDSIMPKLRPYHFHDTSPQAPVKQPHAINNNIYLRPDGRNLAAFLYLLKNKFSKHYQEIVRTIQLVAPFFGDFVMRPNPLNTEMIELEWFERGDDVPFKAHRLSDGTLRFICLTTVLLQPEELRPATIIIDEPELGLHPYAIQILASMIRSESHTTQFIIATQSTNLVSEFEPEDIIVADRVSDKTDLHRISDPEKLKSWLEDYSLGELWEKNLLGGRPSA